MRPDLIKEEAERRHDSACVNGAACEVKDRHMKHFIAQCQRERIAELAELNRRSAEQLAAAWDEGYAAAADGAAGKPPNPYRQEVANEGDD